MDNQLILRQESQAQVLQIHIFRCHKAFAKEYKMYGLDKYTDLSFLLRKSLERVEVSEYQVQLHFSGSICISIEGECKLDKQPVAYAQLAQLVGSSVFGFTIQDDGTTTILFVDGRRLSILDSNEHYESYQISAPGVMIVV